MNQNPVISEFEKWEDAITRLFRSGTEEKIKNPLGEAPTIVFVGPTGSGKTALLNTIIGQTILPEGTDHTTPVPTIMCNGSPPSIRALDSQGNRVPGIPELPISVTGFLKKIPSEKTEVKEMLNRQEYYEDIQNQKQIFWDPAFRKAREKQCGYIEIRMPLPSWIPENIRIADIPGYEGWYPEESSDLHKLVINWLRNADHAVFIMEKSKVLLGGGFKFLALLDHDKAKTMLINQMDTFNPSQIRETVHEEKSFDVFREKIRQRLSEENVPAKNLDIFLGAARIERRCKPWMEDRILTEMHGWFQHFGKIVQNIPSEPVMSG